MGKRTRRSFSKQYNGEVVELIRKSGKSIGAVARELDLSETPDGTPASAVAPLRSPRGPVSGKGRPRVHGLARRRLRINHTAVPITKPVRRARPPRDKAGIATGASPTQTLSNVMLAAPFVSALNRSVAAVSIASNETISRLHGTLGRSKPVLSTVKADK